MCDSTIEEEGFIYIDITNRKRIGKLLLMMMYPFVICTKTALTLKDRYTNQ